MALRLVGLRRVAEQVLLGRWRHSTQLRPGQQSIRVGQQLRYFAGRQKPWPESRPAKARMDHRFQAQVVVARLALLFADIPRRGEATADMSFLAMWKEKT